MKSLWVILKLGIKEKLRERMFLLPFIMGFFVILLSVFFAELSIGEPERVLADFALSLLTLLSATFTIVSVATTISTEIQNQTSLLVLARPISRDAYILAKYCSVVVLTAIMFVLPFLILSLFTSIGLKVFVSYLGMLTEAMVLGAIGICAAQFTRPIFAIIFTFSFWCFSLFLPEMVILLKEQSALQLSDLVRTLSYLTPQLYRFQYHSYESLIRERDAQAILLHIVHTVAWCGSMLWLACNRFRNRDLT